MSLATFESNQRRRKPNLSRRQQDILLQEVVNNQDLLFADPHSTQYNDMKLIVWEQITDKINQVDPNGEVRSPFTVRRKWINWLSFAKKKAEVYKKKVETGEPCTNTDYLTPIENSILKIARDRNINTGGQGDASNDVIRDDGFASTLSDGSDSIEGSAHAPIEIKQESHDDSLLELCEISSDDHHNSWDQNEASVTETPESRTDMRQVRHQQQNILKEQVSSITFATPDTSDFAESEVVINRAPYPTAVFASQRSQSQNINTVSNNGQSTSATTNFVDRTENDIVRKRRKMVHSSDDYVNDEMLSVQKERLEVEKKRLRVEEKRLKIEEERLRIETERFEMERKKMTHLLALA